MKNIHVLPTDKPSNGYILGKCIKELSDVKIGQFTKTYYLMFDKEYFQPHNIYITSDEEIKEGDWVLGDFPDNPIGKVISKYGQEFTAQSLNGDKYGLAEYDSKKIILTTDQDLIKNGVQAIDDEFLEWFIKNPSCEEAEVESKIIKDGVWTDLKGYVELPTIHSINYKIIIPKEEPKQDAINYSLNAFKVPKEYFGKEEPKQETTLEEFIFKVPFDYNIKPKEVIDMCMKEQENIILTWRLGYFIDMINALPEDTEKNRILKSVFDNRDGELLLESYKSMKSHYE